LKGTIPRREHAVFTFGRARTPVPLAMEAIMARKEISVKTYVVKPVIFFQPSRASAVRLFSLSETTSQFTNGFAPAGDPVSAK
jgi:hypothetical protein